MEDAIQNVWITIFAGVLLWFIKEGIGYSIARQRIKAGSFLILTNTYQVPQDRNKKPKKSKTNLSSGANTFLSRLIIALQGGPFMPRYKRICPNT